MSESPAARQHLADDLLDELLPEELDWQGLVRSYPKTSLVVAGLGGYYVGHTRGRAILDALASLAGETVSRGVNEFLGQDVL